MFDEDEQADGADVPRHYQVNVVVLEARHLAVVNADSKVIVTVGNRRKVLRSKTAKTDSPYFNELCIFNFYDTLSSFQTEILKIAIYQSPKFRKDKLLGSFSVELATVWVQPSHQFYHKWAALTDPRNPTAGVRGYLKCDIGILARGAKTKPEDGNLGENIEDNLLVPHGEVNDRQRAKFIFSVFRADNLSEYQEWRALRSVYAYVRITYAGMTGKTTIVKNMLNPSWNEELAFVEMIPALCRYVHVEVCDSLKAAAKGTIAFADLDLRKLSHEGEKGFLPTYGPSFLYMHQNVEKYDSSEKCSSGTVAYECRLLMALRTEVVDYAEDVLVKKTNVKIVKPNSIPPLDEDRYFRYEDFIFFAAVFDILLFDVNLLNNKVGIRVNVGPDKPIDRDQRILRKIIPEDYDDSDSTADMQKSVTFRGLPDPEDTDREDMSRDGSNEATSNAVTRTSFGRWCGAKGSDTRKWKSLRRWPPTWNRRKRFGSSSSASDEKSPDAPTTGYYPKKRRRTTSVREWAALKRLRYWPREWRETRWKREKTGSEESAGSTSDGSEKIFWMRRAWEKKKKKRRTFGSKDSSARSSGKYTTFKDKKELRRILNEWKILQYWPTDWKRKKESTFHHKSEEENTISELDRNTLSKESVHSVEEEDPERTVTVQRNLVFDRPLPIVLGEKNKIAGPALTPDSGPDGPPPIALDEKDAIEDSALNQDAGLRPKSSSNSNESGKAAPNPTTTTTAVQNPKPPRREWRTLKSLRYWPQEWRKRRYKRWKNPSKNLSEIFVTGERKLKNRLRNSKSLRSLRDWPSRWRTKRRIESNPDEEKSFEVRNVATDSDTSSARKKRFRRSSDRFRSAMSSISRARSGSTSDSRGEADPTRKGAPAKDKRPKIRRLLEIYRNHPSPVDWANPSDAEDDSRPRSAAGDDGPNQSAEPESESEVANVHFVSRWWNSSRSPRQCKTLRRLGYWPEKRKYMPRGRSCQCTGDEEEPSSDTTSRKYRKSLWNSSSGTSEPKPRGRRRFPREFLPTPREWKLMRTLKCWPTTWKTKNRTARSRFEMPRKSPREWKPLRTLGAWRPDCKTKNFRKKNKECIPTSSNDGSDDSGSPDKPKGFTGESNDGKPPDVLSAEESETEPENETEETISFNGSEKGSENGKTADAPDGDVDAIGGESDAAEETIVEEPSRQERDTLADQPMESPSVPSAEGTKTAKMRRVNEAERDSKPQLKKKNRNVQQRKRIWFKKTKGHNEADEVGGKPSEETGHEYEELPKDVTDHLPAEYSKTSQHSAAAADGEENEIDEDTKSLEVNDPGPGKKSKKKKKKKEKGKKSIKSDENLNRIPSNDPEEMDNRSESLTPPEKGKKSKGKETKRSPSDAVDSDSSSSDGSYAEDSDDVFKKKGNKFFRRRQVINNYDDDESDDSSDDSSITTDDGDEGSNGDDESDLKQLFGPQRKKRYWNKLWTRKSREDVQDEYPRGEKSKSGNLFSPENTTDLNVQIYFSTKKETGIGKYRKLWPKRWTLKGKDKNGTAAVAPEEIEGKKVQDETQVEELQEEVEDIINYRTETEAAQPSSALKEANGSENGGDKDSAVEENENNMESNAKPERKKFNFWKPRTSKKKAVEKPETTAPYQPRAHDYSEKKNQVKHVRIYNECNTIAPQTIAVKDRYGHTAFSGRYPCLHVNGEWPNALRRMYRTNIVQRSIARFVAGMREVEDEVKNDNRFEASEKLKKVFALLSSDCEEIIRLTGRIEPEDTNLYRERKRYFHREIRIISYKAQIASKKRILIPEEELRRAREYLSTLMRYAEDPEDSFPDCEIWLIKDGKTVAQRRVHMRHVVYSPNEIERGSRSGRVHSVLVRGREGQVVAKLEMFMWFGLEDDFAECRNMLPSGYASDVHTCPGTAVPDIPATVTYAEVHHFRCRIYVFQARILAAADTNGLADPFVRATMLGQSAESQIQRETLNPKWDEMLLFPRITVHGPADFIRDNSVTVTIEVMDYDYLSKNELIGRTLLKPSVKFAGDDYDESNLKLKWEEIRRECSDTGEVLLAAELLELTEEDEEAHAPKEKGKVLPIPQSVRPHSVGYRLEVLFWGIREVKKKWATAARTYVTLECNGKYLTSPDIKILNKSINFPGTVQTLDLELPERHEYKPPLIIKLYQTNSFGHETYTGNCIIPSVQAFYCPTVDDEERKRREIEYQEMLKESKRLKQVEEAEAAAAEEEKRRRYRWRRLKAKLLDWLESIGFLFVKLWKRIKCKIRKSCADVEESQLQDREEEAIDWWARYYASKEHSDSEGVETFVVYEEELEAQPEFRNFSDYIYTFSVTTGKVKKQMDEQITVGKVKAAVKLYRWPLEDGHFQTLHGVDIEKGVLNQLPSNEAIKYVLRVYVISCRNLTPKDIYGKSDPYLILQLGNQRIDDAKNYVPKQLNPIFGRCYEFKGIFPDEHLLRIKVMDHDIASQGDLIGETEIDLESRYYTRHHASCGISNSYYRTGYAAWRDAFRPTEILKMVCKASNMREPEYTETGVRVEEYEFRAANVNRKHKEESEALAALRRWHEVPLRGFHLVPEHIETRALYHPDFPGVEQGKVEMWIDIFPADFRYVPPVVDVEPQKSVPMELRAIIWNVESVTLSDTTLLFNEKMSDIYVRGWINALEKDKQSTDVHYRSMNGEGNFNWRFVFPFDYVQTERRLVVYRKKTAFDIESEELKFPCRLELQVWDNDFFSDDFLGSLNLELYSMPRGAKLSTRCNLSMFEESTPRINLFRIGRTRGWWPFRKIKDLESSEYILAGKVDLELEVLTQKEAQDNPVGKGREEPKALPVPKRPESSFLWFLNPWKTFRYIIFKKYVKHLIIIIIVAMAAAFILLGVYSFPGYAVKRILGA